MAGRDPQYDQRQWKGEPGLVMFGLAIAAIPVFGGLAYVTKEIGPASIPIWAIAAWGAALIFRGPIGQAIGRSIEGRGASAATPEIPQEVYAELDELRARVGELEERVDFSERLLTAAKDEQRNK